MTNEEKISQLEKELNDLKAFVYKDEYSDTKVFRKKVQFKSNVNLGSSVGIQMDKLGFYGIADNPITQQVTFTAPSGGATVDAQARTAINAIKTILTNVGITT